MKTGDTHKMTCGKMAGKAKPIKIKTIPVKTEPKLNPTPVREALQTT